jgi:ABC-type branched-subunit amino acid transport system substrate-binding protein
MYRIEHKFWRKRLALLGTIALGLCLTGTATANTPGVDSKTITVGAILSLTGVFASGAKAQLAGARLYWNKVNNNGGVCNGRKVKIIARDHHYNVQKAVTAYSDIHNRILAVQLLTGTPMTKAIASRMESESVVALPMSWSPELLGRKSILIQGTTYDVDMVNAVDYLVKEGVLKKGGSIGYVYFPGGFGGAGLKGAQFAAKKHGISVKAFQVTPSVSDLSSQIHKMAGAKVDAIFMSVSPPLLANAAAVSHSAGLDVPIVVPTPTFVPALMKSSAAAQINGRVMVVSPYDAWSADLPATKKLRAEYRKSDEKADPQQFVISGYVAAKIMHSALKKVCANSKLTRENLLRAFSKVESFELHGLAVNVSYQDRSTPPSLKTFILKADKDATGGLVPVADHPFKGKSVQSYIKAEYK